MVTLLGREALANADLVAGFKTVLEVVRPWLDHAEVCPMTYRDQEEVLEYVTGQARGGRTCVVCCWGDFNVSARELLARVRRHADQVELVPGISSVQIACAKAGISMEEALFITLHQRSSPSDDLEEVVHYLQENRRHLILLPRPFDLMPAAIANRLIEAGVPGQRPVNVYQRLTLEDEQIWCGTLQECAISEKEHSDLTVLVFPRPASEDETAQRE
jgi:cobalt-precorrin-7 (C5)-methyltransferase